MHLRLLAALSFVALTPLTYAATGSLVVDVSPVSDLLDTLESEQDAQDEGVLFDTSNELFPEQDSGGGTVDESGLVIITVGTQKIFLQDVPKSQWFAPYVRDIAERGLVSGYRDAAGMPTGFFGPADPVTIEQVAKVVVLAAGINTSECPAVPLNVTASGSWSAAYISCAEAKQWAVYSDGGIDVRRPATRSEVVMIVLEAFNRGFDADPTLLPFSDVEQTSAFAPAIAQAAADGVVSGYNDAEGLPTGKFGPGDNVNRAEFVKIMSIAMQLYATIEE